jgi:hypothetical protein
MTTPHLTAPTTPRSASLPAPLATPRATGADGASGANARLAVLLAGSAVALLATTAWAPTATVAPADVELVQLMRAMAMIKGALLALALGALGWRARRPVAPAFALGYATAAWSAAAALGAMWRFAAPGTTAVVLHGAALALFVLASRDRDFFPARTAPTARG